MDPLALLPFLLSPPAGNVTKNKSAFDQAVCLVKGTSGCPREDLNLHALYGH